MKVKDAGGTLVTEKLPIPAMGWSARFRDTEGNLISLFQMDPSNFRLPLPQVQETLSTKKRVPIGQAMARRTIGEPHEERSDE
jgi:hypothetical protein